MLKNARFVCCKCRAMAIKRNLKHANNGDNQHFYKNLKLMSKFKM
jgi:hypothetical protein